MTEKELKEIIEESITQVLTKEYPFLIAPQNNNSEPILEMARINKKENNIFPFTAWEIKIWSNDHTPAHFHIIRDGWNVSFNIETGKIMQIEGKGQNRRVYDYMVNNVEKWLNSPCAIQEKLTNRENATLQWMQLHDNE